MNAILKYTLHNLKYVATSILAIAFWFCLFFGCIGGPLYLGSLIGGFGGFIVAWVLMIIGVCFIHAVIKWVNEPPQQ